MLIDECHHSFEYHSMFRFVEAVRRQFLHRLVHACRLDEERTKHSLFEIDSLRWFVSHLKPEGIKVHLLVRLAP